MMMTIVGVLMSFLIMTAGIMKAILLFGVLYVLGCCGGMFLKKTIQVTMSTFLVMLQEKTVEIVFHCIGAHAMLVLSLIFVSYMFVRIQKWLYPWIPKRLLQCIILGVVFKELIRMSIGAHAMLVLSLIFVSYMFVRI